MGKTKLREVTFGSLLDSETLPSGHRFELMPDTVDVALRVAEAHDPAPWRRKLMQVLAVTKSVGGKDVRENGGADFLGRLLDSDVVFLALAWTSIMNGRKIDISESIPCPSCAARLDSVELNPLVVYARQEPPDGPATYYPVEVEDEFLPQSMRGGSISVAEPTWIQARRRIPENTWENVEVIAMNRAMGAIHVSSGKGKAPRLVSVAEARKMRMRGLQAVISTMEDSIPHIKPVISLSCKECGVASDIPFEQAV